LKKKGGLLEFPV